MRQHELCLANKGPNDKSSQSSEQTTVSPCLCSHHHGCPSNNFLIPPHPSPSCCALVTPSFVCIKQAPLGEVVKHFVQKLCRQKRLQFSLGLSPRPPVGLHSAFTTVLDGRRGHFKMECQLMVVAAQLKSGIRWRWMQNLNPGRFSPGTVYFGSHLQWLCESQGRPGRFGEEFRLLILKALDFPTPTQ